MSLGAEAADTSNLWRPRFQVWVILQKISGSDRA
jgi:hypothetical protein